MRPSARPERREIPRSQGTSFFCLETRILSYARMQYNVCKNMLRHGDVVWRQFSAEGNSWLCDQCKKTDGFLVCGIQFGLLKGLFENCIGVYVARTKKRDADYNSLSAPQYYVRQPKARKTALDQMSEVHSHEPYRHKWYFNPLSSEFVASRRTFFTFLEGRDRMHPHP
jgi:hypothetical protein